jgi:hypothetical protein
MNQIRWRAWLLVGAFAATLVGMGPSPAGAFNQPPYNLGLTNAMDGAIPGPGFYAMTYAQIYFGKEIKVNDDVPELTPFSPLPLKSSLEATEVTTLAAVWQIAYISELELLGGFLGWNVVIPVVVLDSKGPINRFIDDVQDSQGVPRNLWIGQIENTGGVGDIIMGPVIQWSGKSLFGKPYFHRVELDVIIPTGKYSEDYLLNPGSNIVTFNPYYAFTWFLTQKTDFSMRIHYAWNSTNTRPYQVLYGPAATLRPGQNFHFNYTLQQNFYKTLWGGISGYCMWQITDDELKNAALPPPLVEALIQKEQVFAIGPILSLTPLKNLLISWASAWEMGAKNRPEGFKTTFKVLYGF